MYKYFFKRFFDIVFSIVGLVIFTPVFVIVFICLFCITNEKPLFYQKRPGKKGRIFSIIKFKTMNDKRDSQGNLLDDASRLTNIGKIIRKTSIDELPQLLNVLKGDMSLIGPRPLLPEYLPLYNETQRKRHDVKPGVTGWAQVNGRNAISWQKKFEYDVWYVNNLSLALDFKIIIKTILKVTRSEDINSKNQSTTTKFTGN